MLVGSGSYKNYQNWVVAMLQTDSGRRGGREMLGVTVEHLICDRGDIHCTLYTPKSQ
jgi:hypothetical protein